MHGCAVLFEASLSGLQVRLNDELFSAIRYFGTNVQLVLGLYVCNREPDSGNDGDKQIVVDNHIRHSRRGQTSVTAGYIVKSVRTCI